MEFSDVLRGRRMVRRYDPTPLDPDVLRAVLAAALRAPSAGNSQGRDLLVLTSAVHRDAFWRLCSAGRPGPADGWLTGMRTAPVLVVLLADPGAYAARYSRPDKPGPDRDPDTWEVAWPDVDVGMSGLLLLLAAVDAGLGACLIGVPGAAHRAVREHFAVPDRRRVVAAVTLGHPAPDERSRPSRRRRRDLSETAHDGRFGVPWNL
ncbi:MAG: nitroreductase family protein [Janthinobacterium lividum]